MRLTLVNLIKNSAWSHFKGAVKDATHFGLAGLWQFDIPRFLLPYQNNQNSTKRNTKLLLRFNIILLRFNIIIFI